MDIIDFALQVELDGKAFYLKGAEATRQEGLKKIFLQLADEEEKHYRFFKKLKEGQFEEAAKEMDTESTTMQVTKTVFKELVEQGTSVLPGEDEKAVWSEALKVEEKTEKMYREEAERESDPARKALLNRLADEEKNHVYLIDNILVFLKDPGGFGESQQYRSFMSWEGKGGMGM